MPVAVAAAGNSKNIVADRLSTSEETAKGQMRTNPSKLSANAVTITVKRGVIDVR